MDRKEFLKKVALAAVAAPIGASMLATQIAKGKVNSSSFKRTEECINCGQCLPEMADPVLVEGDEHPEWNGAYGTISTDGTEIYGVGTSAAESVFRAIEVCAPKALV